MTTLLLVQGIKLPSYENEDVIVNCVLESSIKFFKHGSPVAVVPQIIYGMETTDSVTRFATLNITFDTDKKCVQEPTILEGNRLSKYFDVSEFENYVIFFSQLVPYC